LPVADWKQFSLVSLNPLVQPGTNIVAIAVSNPASGAGLTGRLDYRGADGSTNTLDAVRPRKALGRRAGNRQPHYSDKLTLSFDDFFLKSQSPKALSFPAPS